MLLSVSNRAGGVPSGRVTYATPAAGQRPDAGPARPRCASRADGGLGRDRARRVYLMHWPFDGATGRLLAKAWLRPVCAHYDKQPKTRKDDDGRSR